MPSNDISIIFSHPNTRSFIASIAGAMKKSMEDKRQVYMQDLYRDEFDPVLTTPQLLRHLATDSISLRYAKEISSSSILVFLYPLWWGMPPAIMKGWLDKLLMPNFAFSHSADVVGFASKSTVKTEPLFSSKSLLVVYTADDPTEHSVIQSQWKYIAAYIGASLVNVAGMSNLRVTSHRERRAFTDQLIQTMSAMTEKY